MVIDMLEGTVMIIEMITGIEIIDDEVVVGVEIGIHVTVTERGIIVAIAGVAATALMVTRSMGGTVCLLHVEVLVVAEVAATVLMITRGVAETGLLIREYWNFFCLSVVLSILFFCSITISSASPASRSPSRSPPRKTSPSPERSPVRRKRNDDRSPRSRSPST